MNKKPFLQMCLFLFIFASQVRSEPTLSELDIDERTKNELQALGYDSNSTIREALEAHNDQRWISRVYGGLLSAISNQETSMDEARVYTELLTLGIEDSSGKDLVLERLSMPPFEKSYFNEQARENLLNKSSDTISADFIRVLGVAEIDHPAFDLEEMSRREKLFDDERTNLMFQNLGIETGNFLKSHIWAAMLVQARRGDEVALAQIQDYMADIETEDLYKRYREAVIDLGYVRQPETIDLLVEYLKDEKGGPRDPIPLLHPQQQIFHGVAPIAVRALSLSLADFPFSKDDYWTKSDFWEDVEVAREFIKNYEGEWRIIGKWEPGEQPPASTVEIVQQVTRPGSAKEEPSEATPVEVAGEIPEQSSQWWLWLIGLLVGFGGLALVLRRRS